MQVANINQSATMSSLELVAFINLDRKERAHAAGVEFPSKGHAELQHNHFMAKVPEVLGESAVKFLGTAKYTNGTGALVSRNIYNFPKREACLMAMSYSYELQAKVFDRMTELEAKQAPTHKIPQTLSEALLLGAELAKKVEEQANQLAIAAPKVAIYEVLADRKQDVSTTVIAKHLGTTAIKLNQFLREKGVKWLNADLPKAGYMEWFNVISDVKNGYEFQQCVVTPLGQIKIAELWTES